ncbi:MAG: MBL fold metallo-hydrolase [Cyanothece sp. SIO1E1]|nr:MBL fold metallo-hydrolase [Cyanothece sp. SIO1E1]
MTEHPTSALGDNANTQLGSTKPPHSVFESIFAFSPNRDTMGGTAYLIVENDANTLIDCPAWDLKNQHFLQSKGGVRQLFLTHRGGIGKVKEIQQAFNCEIIIQEQEAYLLPGLSVTPFRREFDLSPNCRAIWTPGHSPGAACLYYSAYGGVLFSGRHLLPNRLGNPEPLRIAKTFHWPRQISSTRQLLNQFSPDTLRFICPGASVGFLRGKHAINQAYTRLAQLDLENCLQGRPLL